MKNVVHIYEQYAHHCDVIILGDKEGLRNLQNAVTQALDNPPDGKADVFCNDGEGYSIRVAMVNHIDDIPVAYTADYAADKKGISPANFLNPFERTTLGD